MRSVAAKKITFHEVYQCCLRNAGGLSRLSKPGDRVVVICNESVDTVVALLSVLCAGRVPVPFAPPESAGCNLEEYGTRLKGILDHCGANFVLKPDGGRPNPPWAAGARVVELAELRMGPAQMECVSCAIDELALVQYTSGSTGRPKGVRLTHRNIVANVSGIGNAVAVTRADCAVAWLPLYHDMGLIGTALFTLRWGIGYVLLTTKQFLAHPESWLWSISRFGGTLSPAPNFAFQYCVKRIPESALEGLDLGSWRVAFNGSEEVRPRTLAEFAERMTRHGLKQGVLLPVYGLAESAVAVAFADVGRPARIDRIHRATLEEVAMAVPCGADDCAREVVSVGRPIEGQRVRIVGEMGDDLGERCVGEIEVSGPSVMEGYHNDPVSTTRALTSDGWLKTGDRGYMADGELFFVGRMKDIIKLRGRVVDPMDIEDAVSKECDIRLGRVAAIGVPDDTTGSERLVLVAEVGRGAEVDSDSASLKARLAVGRRCGVTPDDVVFVLPGQLPRTSSGKPRRAELRNLYVNGRLRGWTQAGPARSQEDDETARPVSGAT
ncbi:MAG TPA: fatty acyl-AMP ligase [Polyangiaceae bacterium]|nr:fatty acyl-AMP ligase [Polyangiaceae bacterium]